MSPALCLGVVYILFLVPLPLVDITTDMVLSHQKIEAQTGGFTGQIKAQEHFGCSVAFGPDLNNDGVPELLVGTKKFINRGAVFILFLSEAGLVLSHITLGADNRDGGLTVALPTGTRFGCSVHWLPDLDLLDGPDLVVGACRDDDSGFNVGAVYIIFLATSGQTISHQKISFLTPSFTAELVPTIEDMDFGEAVHSANDLNGDGITDILVGAQGAYDGAGEMYIIFLYPTGTVLSHLKIREFEGGFTADISSSVMAGFGEDLCVVGDVNLDGYPDFAVGSGYDDDLGTRAGAAYVIFGEPMLGKHYRVALSLLFLHFTITIQQP